MLLRNNCSAVRRHRVLGRLSQNYAGALSISAENAGRRTSIHGLVTLPQRDETQIQTIAFSSNPEADSFVFAVTVLTLRPKVIIRKWETDIPFGKLEDGFSF